MSCRPVFVACLLLGLVPARADEAAERAQRAADNPFRMIIEAAKIKARKAGEKGAGAPAAPAVPAAAAASAARPALASASRPLPRAEAVVRAADGAASAPAAAAEPAAPEVPLVVVEAPAREQPESAVATIEVAAGAPAPQPSEVLASEPAPPVPLKLLEVVEPVLPRALAGQLRGELRAQVAFMVATDGAVREARLQSITHPLMGPSVLQAVRQWRYQAIPEARAHEVEIVLRQD